MVSMGWPTAVASTPAAAPVTKCDIVRYLFEAATLRCLGPCEAGAYHYWGVPLWVYKAMLRSVLLFHRVAIFRLRTSSPS